MNFYYVIFLECGKSLGSAVGFFIVKNMLSVSKIVELLKRAGCLNENMDAKIVYSIYKAVLDVYIYSYKYMYLYLHIYIYIYIYI